MILSKCAICGRKKLIFIKKQEVGWILSNLDLKTPLNKILLLGDILLQNYKMNEIVSKLLLAGYRFMPEMYLK